MGFSKKGKCIVIYALKRLLWIQFETEKDMKIFLDIFANIFNSRDGLPIYIPSSPVGLST